MSQPSSIDRLPSEVREALHGWLRDPAVTQAEAADRANAMLDELAAQRPREKRAGRISKSAVNRHERRRRKAAERTRQSRLVADAWIASLHFSPRGEAKCVRGPSGRGASRLARAGVLEQYVEHGK